MNATHQYHIINLFVFLDDHLGRQTYVTGRKPMLSNAELLTILLFSALTENHQRLSEVYTWVKRIYPGWFRLPAYKNFVISCHPRIAGDGGSLKGSVGGALALALRRFNYAACLPKSQS